MAGRFSIPTKLTEKPIGEMTKLIDALEKFRMESICCPACLMAKSDNKTETRRTMFSYRIIIKPD